MLACAVPACTRACVCVRVCVCLRFRRAPVRVCVCLRFRTAFVKAFKIPEDVDREVVEQNIILLAAGGIAYEKGGLACLMEPRLDQEPLLVAP